MAANKSHEASSSSSSSSRGRWRYDVFLSFRGEDTRKNFTDHLYIALQNAGINNVFRDDNELRVGENISTELLEAIQDSRISIIVLSRDYAASSWCLEELVKIMECRKTVQQVVLPVFYKVDPSDVRKQSGSFEEAFAQHEKRFKTEKEKELRWRNALTEAANLKGCHYTVEKHEGEFIKEIVDEILNHANNTYLNEATYPVGLKSRVRQVNSLLSVGLNDVRIIGICAMGGMGKTTIAKSVYNYFFQYFEHKSFLKNVSEISKQPNGLVHLQQQLLYDILKKKNIEVNNDDQGINMIKERLSNKRILMVLDDVDHLTQLSALARNHDWFGLGSRIIITARDKQLPEAIEADGIYMVEELDDDESLELFSWHAFRRSDPKEDFVKLSKDVIGYCKGLPLALEVLGSSLFGRNPSHWKGALNKLERIPDNQIQNKLRISYDALGDDKEKAIFLDIACFFIGVDKDYATTILDGCGFFAEVGIGVLITRCLLKINIDNRLMMHDLLRDMGREIVRQECPKELGNCSRLWSHDDVLDVLKRHKGTKAVEGLILKLPTQNEEHFSTKAFANMDNLRLLQLNHVLLRGSYGHFSKDLRWVCWHGFPLKVILKNFHLENLVVLDMRYSNLRQFSKEIKLVLQKLKVLNLSHSYYLTKTPNFSKTPNLEELKLKDCTSLVEVHPSIGNLHRLVLLDMRDCKQLKSLPNSMEDMEALIELRVDNTAIRQVPALKNIKILSLCGWTGLTSRSSGSVFWSWVSPRESLNSVNLLLPSLLGLTSLVSLNLGYCNLSEDVIAKDFAFGSLYSLEELNLSGNNFCCLPARISTLPKLNRLNVGYCKSLVSLPELPASLTYLEASYCNNFVKLPANFSNLPELSELHVNECTSLQSLPDLPINFGNLEARGCTSLERLPNVSRLIGRTWRAVGLDLIGCPKLALNPGWKDSINDLNMYTSKNNLVASAVMDPPRLMFSLSLSLTLMGFGFSLVSFILNPRFVLVPGKEIPSYFCHQSISPLLCLPVLRDFEDAVLDVCILSEFGRYLWLRRYEGLVLRSGDQLELLIRQERPQSMKVKKWGVHLNDKYKGGTIQSNGVNQILHNICSNAVDFWVGYGDFPLGIDLNINIKPT